LTAVAVSPFIAAIVIKGREAAQGAFMVGLAAAMFVGLFAFGAQFFGWSQSAHEQLQLGLFLSFILGIICGYKTKG
jgi:hypothetical protein